MSKVTVEVVKPFERFAKGDKPELSKLRAEALEKMGLVRQINPKASKASA